VVSPFPFFVAGCQASTKEKQVLSLPGGGIVNPVQATDLPSSTIILTCSHKPQKEPDQKDPEGTGCNTRLLSIEGETSSYITSRPR
jgi:hypothetical protein